jgi:hypothetical protein
MSGRALIVLNSPAARARAMNWIAKAPDWTRVEFKGQKRTLSQNAKLWSMLSDISVQFKWHDMHLSADDWKCVFVDALKRELRIVPNLDGTGFVNLGRSSSDLSKDEFGQLIELITAFGAQHGVTFHDQAEPPVEDDRKLEAAE